MQLAGGAGTLQSLPRAAASPSGTPVAKGTVNLSKKDTSYCPNSTPLQQDLFRKTLNFLGQLCPQGATRVCPACEDPLPRAGAGGGVQGI